MAIREFVDDLALHALSREGLESLRGRRWTFIGIVGPLLGFVADICTVFGPVSEWALAIVSVAFCTFAVAVAFRTQFCRQCAFPCVVTFILALSFGVIVIIQKATATEDQGVLAARVPAIAAVQDELREIAERVARIDMGVAKVDKTTERIEAKLDVLLLAQHLTASNLTNVPPGVQQSVTEALTSAVKGAVAGDARLQQALELLQQNKIAEAETMFRAVAEEKSARIQKDRKDTASAYRNLGAIAGLAEPKKALDAYENALEFDPDDLESLFRVGEIQIDRGYLDEAQTRLDRLLSLAADDQWFYRIWGRFLVGDIDKERGNLNGALKSYRDGLAIADRLAKSDPGNIEWQRDLSVSFNNVGDVQVAQGDLAGALKSYRDGLAIADRLAKSDPGNAGWQRDLSVSFGNLARVFTKTGQAAKALDVLRQGRAIMARLTELSADNAVWKNDLNWFNSQIATLTR